MVSFSICLGCILAVLGNRIYVNGVELQYASSAGGNPSGNSAWNTGSQEHTMEETQVIPVDIMMG